MTILDSSSNSSSSSSSTTTFPDSYNSFDDDVVDPTCIIIALSISISIFPFILALGLMTVHHLPTWTKNIVPYSYLFLNNSSSSSSSNIMSSNNNYRGRRGGGSGRVNKSIRTTKTTFRDLLMLYQGLIPAGYIAFPLWILYRSIGKNDNSGAGDGSTKDDDAIGGGGGGGVYSFIAILTVMGIFSHFGEKILSSFLLVPRHWWLWDREEKVI